MLIILGVFIYNLKQPSVAKMELKLKDTKRKSSSEGKDSQSSSSKTHNKLEQRLQGMLESQSADISCHCDSTTLHLKRPRSASTKSYGSVEVDFDNNDHRSKRQKELFKGES